MPTISDIEAHNYGKHIRLQFKLPSPADGSGRWLPSWIASLFAWAPAWGQGPGGTGGCMGTRWKTGILLEGSGRKEQGYELEI
jgi:hypothetical protein